MFSLYRLKITPNKINSFIFNRYSNRYSHYINQYGLNFKKFFIVFLLRNGINLGLLPAL